MTESIVIKPFGGNGGNEFSMQCPTSIGLCTGSEVDQLRINEVVHGGNGGGDRGSIILRSDEYISSMIIRSGKRIDYLEFKTNKGNSIKGGGTGGSEQTFNNIRVLSIGGRSGKRVDKLNIMYIENYSPSSVVAKDVGFIISYTAPFCTFTQYEDSTYQTMDSYEKTTHSMLKQDYSASIEGEYFAKVSASTDITIENSKSETVKSELSTQLSKGSSKTVEIKEGYVGVTLVNGTLMKGSDGAFWMHPTSLPSYTIIKITDYSPLLNHYDLTGELYTQISGLTTYRSVTNGYVYYGATATTN